MSESVIADFPAEVIFTTSYQTDPEPCRVVLNPKHLIVASSGQNEKISLSSIFDIIVSRIPADLADFFDQTVLIGYTKNRTRRTILIQGEHGRIDKFAMYLYKATLQGRTANVKHPARQGGRIVDSPHRTARIYPQPHSVRFESDEDDFEFEIDLSVITDISHMKRTIEGETQPVLSVRHMTERQAVTSEIFHPSVRKLNILARYLRLRYFQLEEELRKIDVTDEETEALVALYSGGEPEHLAGMLDREEEYVDEMLEELVEKELISDKEDADLTSWGRLLVSDRIEDVNV